MATEINSITLNKALELLKSGYVLSKKNIRIDGKTGEKTHGVNVCQILHKDDEFCFMGFDSFGNKIKNRCHVIKEDEILSNLNTYSREIITYHKQRISKKTNDKSIVDEETAKILVYDWLLKKYKNVDDVIVPEITLGSRRADYMAFGKKEICVVEIKSEVDTIERLQEQINQYIKYANLVYIAIHKNKIASIDSLDIPDFVGIIKIDKKLSIVKKAKKQKVDFGVFRGFVSYQEFLVMRSGFKGSSTIEKMDMEVIFDSFFSDKQKNDFLFELMKNRHKSESKKRMDAQKSGDIKRAVGNAKGVGVDRLSQNVATFLSLKSFFDLDEKFIYDYLETLDNKVTKIYSGWKYLELLKNDWILLLNVLKKFNIPYRSDNSKILKLFIFIDNSKILLEQKQAIEYIIDSNIQEAVFRASAIKNGNYLLIETRSKEAQKLIIDKLLESQTKYESSVMTSGFYGVIKTSMFNEENILILNNKIRKFFHLEKEIEKIELWDRKLI